MKEVRKYSAPPNEWAFIFPQTSLWTRDPVVLLLGFFHWSWRQTLFACLWHTSHITLYPCVVEIEPLHQVNSGKLLQTLHIEMSITLVPQNFLWCLYNTGVLVDFAVEYILVTFTPNLVPGPTIWQPLSSNSVTFPFSAAFATLMRLYDSAGT